jgi:hypothetical protein
MRNIILPKANECFAWNLPRISPIAIIGLASHSGSSHEVLPSVKHQSHRSTVERNIALSANLA